MQNGVIFQVDFNEMLDTDLVLLSVTDQRLDASGKPITLRAGMEVTVFMEDESDDGESDRLLAHGKIELHDNNAGQRDDPAWARHVKWRCRIDQHGIQHASALTGRGTLAANQA